MFYELNNYMFNWIYIFGRRIWCKDIHLQTVWTAVLITIEINAASNHLRIKAPKGNGAAVVGAAFAVAGAVMQGVTRNPLADAGVLGINAGAMFVVALSFAFSRICRIPI